MPPARGARRSRCTASIVSRAVSSAWRASSALTLVESSDGYSAWFRRRRNRGIRAKTSIPPSSPNCARTASMTAMWPPRVVARRPCAASNAADASRPRRSRVGALREDRRQCPDRRGGHGLGLHHKPRRDVRRCRDTLELAGLEQLLDAGSTALPRERTVACTGRPIPASARSTASSTASRSGDAMTSTSMSFGNRPASPRYRAAHDPNTTTAAACPFGAHDR